MPPLRLLPELESAIRELPCVRASSVVTDSDATPVEVHVVATPGKPAKQIVRDVQSLSLAEFGIGLDHRIVSVVQIAEPVPPVNDVPTPIADSIPTTQVDTAPAPEPVSEPISPRRSKHRAETQQRARLDNVVVSTRASSFDAAVSLLRGEEMLEGRATGPPLPTTRLKLVADATLDAVSEHLGLLCVTDQVSVLDSPTAQVALVVLRLLPPGCGEQLMSGSAVVRVDEPDAVARAVLDALNRRLDG